MTPCWWCLGDRIVWSGRFREVWSGRFRELAGGCMTYRPCLECQDDGVIPRTRCEHVWTRSTPGTKRCARCSVLTEAEA